VNAWILTLPLTAIFAWALYKVLLFVFKIP
jgi:hypothetical protein